MENIVYEEELVTEQVFEGDFVLDGHMTLEQQNESIFQMMRDAGIEVNNKSEYRIGYDGVEDDNGISETQTSHFVVTRTYKKPVPYKLEREEIYDGVWALDGIRMTPEEQRQKIFDMMRKDGVEVGNEDELEIGYEGADDNMGISETQTTRFVVFRVHKEKLTKEEREELEKEDKIQSIYEELVSLREKVRATSNAKEISALADRIEELSHRLDELVTESTRDYRPFESALAEIEAQMKEIQDAITKNMKDYMDSYERIKQLLGDETSLLKENMTAAEYDRRMEELVREKMAENEESLSIREEIEKQAEALRQLLKKRDRIRKDLVMAQQLGLSALEYKELTDNFRSRKLVNAIIEKKGLGDLIAIPAKDRTPEQKRQIKAIRKEILEELAKAKKEHAESSILNLVEALYGIETQVQLKGKQRVLIVKPKSLENIKKNAAKMPEKIKVTEEVDRSYEPGEAPEDMKEVMERVQQDEIHPVIEKFTFFRDARYPDKIFVREAVFDRFNIDEVGPEVRIDGSLCFEIDPQDAENILANRENDYSPYIVEFEDVTLEGELDRHTVLDRVMPVVDIPQVHEVLPTDADEKIDRVMPVIDTPVQENVVTDTTEDVVRDVIDTPQERVFGPEDESEELIPGTNFHKPRARGIYETDEEYVEFLKEYYDHIFGNPENVIAASDSRVAEEEPKTYVKEKEDTPTGDTPTDDTPTDIKEDVVRDVIDTPRRSLIERYTIYRDIEEPDHLYARKYFFERFDIGPIGPGVRVAGALCFPMQMLLRLKRMRIIRFHHTRLNT